MALPFPYGTINSNQLQQKRKIFLGAEKFAAFGTATLTRGAKGNYYWAVGASLTTQFVSSLSQAINNYQDANVSYTNAQAVNGDMALNSATAVYQVSVANLTSATLGVSESTFGAATAPVVTDLIAPATLGIVFGANIQEVTVTPSTNKALVINPAEIVVEAIFVTPSSSTFHFYGVILDVMYSR